MCTIYATAGAPLGRRQMYSKLTALALIKLSQRYNYSILLGSSGKNQAGRRAFAFARCLPSARSARWNANIFTWARFYEKDHFPSFNFCRLNRLGRFFRTNPSGCLANYHTNYKFARISCLLIVRFGRRTFLTFSDYFRSPVSQQSPALCKELHSCGYT